MTATYHDLDTPIGTLRLVGGEDSIDRIELPNRAAGAPDAAWETADGDLPAALADTRRQLEEYFAGERQEFDLPLSAGGTEFQQRVWAELRRIPFGETISYGELAARIGKPSASRAVGAANGRNPLPVVVPCHRVIGSDGRLTGFGGGLPTKQALLDLEQRVAGRQLRLSPVLSSRATS
ncbi:MAG: methylated-DNA--[protein]-cysteine S-methyltransferase [Holophagales bacterium]|nr:methylated-DNA--[protein]-cysteine S-methyltransferase [Holophagales bacterium]MYF95866.1 methylated-DNA--[protein]-cysteine S-methyltransferase [Holophagales bacterium]